jgi:hypothetical protein
MRSRPSFLRVLALLSLVAAVWATRASAVSSRPAAGKQPFVAGAEPGLSRLAGNEVLVILGDPAALTLTPNTALWDGRASDGRVLGSGVYFAVLERSGVPATRRIVLAR